MAQKLTPFDKLAGSISFLCACGVLLKKPSFAKNKLSVILK